MCGPQHINIDNDEAAQLGRGWARFQSCGHNTGTHSLSFRSVGNFGYITYTLVVFLV